MFVESVTLNKSPLLCFSSFCQEPEELWSESQLGHRAKRFPVSQLGASSPRGSKGISTARWQSPVTERTQISGWYLNQSPISAHPLCLLTGFRMQLFPCSLLMVVVWYFEQTWEYQRWIIIKALDDLFSTVPTYQHLFVPSRVNKTLCCQEAYQQNAFARMFTSQQLVFS